MSNLFNDNTIQPPQDIINALLNFFISPLNIEWFKKNESYEAIFYSQNKEHIAHLSFDGIIKDYRVNRLIEELPILIERQIKPKGEIMNVVSIHSKNETRYEVIFRDKNLKRFLALFDNSGIETCIKTL
jgi:hypothetical protein